MLSARQLQTCKAAMKISVAGNPRNAHEICISLGAVNCGEEHESAASGARGPRAEAQAKLKEFEGCLFEETGTVYCGCEHFRGGVRMCNMAPVLVLVLYCCIQN
jgi:hypothetical protein